MKKFLTLATLGSMLMSTVVLADITPLQGGYDTDAKALKVEGAVAQEIFDAIPGFGEPNFSGDVGVGRKKTGAVGVCYLYNWRPRPAKPVYECIISVQELGRAFSR